MAALAASAQRSACMAAWLDVHVPRLCVCAALVDLRVDVLIIFQTKIRHLPRPPCRLRPVHTAALSVPGGVPRKAAPSRRTSFCVHGKQSSMQCASAVSPSQIAISPTIKLNDGNQHPQIGYGTYKVGFIPASASSAGGIATGQGGDAKGTVQVRTIASHHLQCS